MSRGLRSILVGVGVAAVALAGAGGAARADDTTSSTTGSTITALPAKALLNAGKTPAEFVKVQLTVPTGVDCMTGMTARVVGSHTAVTVVAAPDCASVQGSAVWTVTANAATKKHEAVVKFVSTASGTSARKVGSLNVKVLTTPSTTPVVKPVATTYPSGSEVTTFPARTVLLGGTTPQFVTVKLTLPAGITCPTDLVTRVVGQRNAVTVSAVACGTGVATWTVTANTITHKRHAVVKFITVNPADQVRTVSSLNVKVNPGTRPAKPAKPAKGQGQQGQG